MLSSSAITQGPRRNTAASKIGTALEFLEGCSSPQGYSEVPLGNGCAELRTRRWARAGWDSISPAERIRG